MFLIKHWCTSILLVSSGSKESKWSFFYSCLSCMVVQNECQRVHGSTRLNNDSWCPLWCLHATHLRSASHMHARYRQGGDVHSDTAVQVQGANEEEEPPTRYWPENGHYGRQNWVISAVIWHLFKSTKCSTLFSMVLSTSLRSEVFYSAGQIKFNCHTKKTPQ